MAADNRTEPRGRDVSTWDGEPMTPHASRYVGEGATRTPWDPPYGESLLDAIVREAIKEQDHTGEILVRFAGFAQPESIERLYACGGVSIGEAK